MPKRTRLPIGRLSRQATHARLSRSQEDAQTREERLERDADRHRSQRADESDERRQMRLAGDAERHTRARLGDSSEAAQNRSEENAARQREARANEDDLSRDNRLGENAARQREARANEDDLSRNNRLGENAARQREARANEDDLSRNNRLGENAARQRELRERENGGERNQRLRQNRVRAVEVVRRRRLPLLNAGRLAAVSLFSENDFFNNATIHSCGPFTTVCRHCSAFKWPLERSTFCCRDGSVVLQHPPPPPQELLSLYDATNNTNILKQIRSYNNTFALASLGCHEVINPGFNPTFKVQGKMYHRLGSLLPVQGEQPKFAQMYFFDSDLQINQAMQNNGTRLDEGALLLIQQSLIENNPYIRSIKAAAEIPKEEGKLVIHSDRSMMPREEHCRRYNLPTNSEVSVLRAGDASSNLDIILHHRNNQLIRINHIHRSYDPLHYVLLFPYGEDGWQLNLSRTNAANLSALDFYSFRFQVRSNDFNIIMKSQKLMQQYAVDSWMKVEHCRMKWVEKADNQKTLRAELYQGLQDALDSGDVENAGKRIILPSSIYGTPRFYAQAFQDAMCIVRHFGKPDYFITFTTNPKWPEVIQALNPGEFPRDRPDLLARVFKIKLDAMMNDLTKKHVIGKTVAHTVVIEWQKRGLTHAHILLIMDNEAKPRTPEIVDHVVSAELPDPVLNPQLFHIIKSNNIHGPCGAVNPNCVCMDGVGIERKCTKSFPKPFSENTKMGDSYPEYRRRSPQMGGHSVEIPVQGNPFYVNNSFIVPYNPFLSLKYQAHINVEVVHSVQAVKYLYKYITKGSDRVITSVNMANEIERYINARYVSASEAFWKLYGFEIYHKYPPVELLPLHLENKQPVIFQEDQAHVVASNPPPTTKLTAYFLTNVRDEEARTICYPDFPKYFVWDKKNSKWKRRRRGRQDNNQGDFTADNLGRIPIISLTQRQSELYFLRMILYNKSGHRNFDELKNINGIQYPSFQAACVALGLLDDDTENDEVMREASTFQFGSQLRDLFANILLYSFVQDPLQFWENHKLELCRDLMLSQNLQEPSEEIINEVLLYLQDRVQREGYADLHTAFNLPLPNPLMAHAHNIPVVIREETSYNVDLLRNQVNTSYPSLNDEQKIAFDSIIESVENQDGKVFSLNAFGGTGKTYTINLILQAVRARGYIALATASSGIASTLLHNGRTLHSRAKIPININESSTCNIGKREATAELFRRARLFLNDEVTMNHRHVVEALERTLRDIRGIDAPFGGITILLSGDWRQILPVVVKGGRADIVDACLKSSHLWDNVKHLSLTQNMRANNDQHFADMLLKFGDGREEYLTDIGQYKVKVPTHLVLNSSNVSDLCSFVFENLDDNYNNPQWLCSRSIICPTNEEVDEINDIMISRFPSDVERTYYSSDSLLDGNEHQYPLEYINTLNTSGMPPHKLHLKIGCSIILLRNMDLSNGHGNGARYVVRQLSIRIIEAELSTGPHAGKILYIPRIPICPSQTTFPFQMKRIQFPVKLAFSVTSNKAQGQTLSKVGIYLGRNFFSHGQLYVAMSRVSSSANIKILARNATFPNKDGHFIDNVVYPEVL